MKMSKQKGNCLLRVALFLSLPVLVLFIWTSYLPSLDYDPDEFRTTCEIVTARGFQCETHYVLSRQGYILELHRVLHPFLRFASSSRRPVILQHGLTGTSTNFIMASPVVSFSTAVLGQNMGIELAKRGFDVWLANHRGNDYALKHVRLSSSDAQFWNFTFEDIGRYDLPAVIDYVRLATGSAKVSYIGHSQGTAVMFALLAEPALAREYGHIVEPFVAISPIAYIGNATTAYRYFVSALNHFGSRQDGPVFMKPSRFAQIKSVACNSALRVLCKWALFATMGYSEQTNLTRLAVYMAHMTSTSSRNLLHFHQLFSSNRFARFDYGAEENIRQYGQPIAPEYDLRQISHRAIHVIYSRNDLFTPMDGLQQLRDDIQTLKEMYEIGDPLANHGDPLIGMDVALEVNHKVLSILSQY